jgi:hypothetical protein
MVREKGVAMILFMSRIMEADLRICPVNDGVDSRFLFASNRFMAFPDWVQYKNSKKP